MRSLTLLGAFMLLLLHAACTSTPATPRAEVTAATPSAEVAAVIPTPAQARAVPLFRADGAPTTWEDLIAAAGNADVLVIGENHGHALGLAFAAEVWSDVLARHPRAVLSMEFFNRDEQSRLDDYLAGLTDEAAFRTATSRTKDSAYPPGHRAMVEAAKARGRPVIASNAPRVYVRAARREPYEQLQRLSPEQRRLFRVPDALPDKANRYRADFDALMSDPAMASHTGPAAPETPEQLRNRLDGGFRSQSLWDWTMAESVVRAIDAGTPVVHVVGRFHSDFDGGLVQALRLLRPGVRVVTLSVVDAEAFGARPADTGRGSFVAYVGPSASN